MSDWDFEQVADQDALTEGPAWDGSALLYSECGASRTWRYDPATGQNTLWREGTNGANGMVFDRDGVLFACEGEGRRIVRYAEGQPAEVVVDAWEGAPFNEPNDLAVDDRGRVWFTDPNYGGRPLSIPHESVYRADPQPDGSYVAQRVTFDTARPNGILVSPDQRTLYVAESPRPIEARRRLVAYAINDDGSLGEQQARHDFGWGRGIDGMCWEAGGAIVATAGYRERGPGPMVYIFATDGRVLETHPTPADRPTNCSFGGPGLDVLYVTFGGGEVYRVANTGRRGLLAYPPAAG